MYQNLYRTCRVIVLLIKPFVLWRSRQPSLSRMLKFPPRVRLFEQSNECQTAKLQNHAGRVTKSPYDTSSSLPRNYSAVPYLNVAEWRQTFPIFVFPCQSVFVLPYVMLASPLERSRLCSSKIPLSLCSKTNKWGSTCCKSRGKKQWLWYVAQTCPGELSNMRDFR